MPLPIPRWVISSPIHMSSTVPAVRHTTMRKTRPKVKFLTTSWPASWPKERNRNT